MNQHYSFKDHLKTYNNYKHNMDLSKDQKPHSSKAAPGKGLRWAPGRLCLVAASGAARGGPGGLAASGDFEGDGSLGQSLGGVLFFCCLKDVFFSKICQQSFGVLWLFFWKTIFGLEGLLVLWWCVGFHYIQFQDFVYVMQVFGSTICFTFNPS